MTKVTGLPGLSVCRSRPFVSSEKSIRVERPVRAPSEGSLDTGGALVIDLIMQLLNGRRREYQIRQPERHFGDEVSHDTLGATGYTPRRYAGPMW